MSDSQRAEDQEYGNDAATTREVADLRERVRDLETIVRFLARTNEDLRRVTGYPASLPTEQFVRLSAERLRA